MCSQSELIHAFPNNSSREICREPWLYNFSGLCFFVQVSPLSCRIIVDCKKQPEPVHYFAPTFLQETWYDHPKWAVAIFLLVGQELERKVLTDSLRCRVCPKYFGISVVLAVLCVQDSVRDLHSHWPPQAAHHQVHCFFAYPEGDPPNVVFKREAVTTRHTYDNATPPTPSLGAIILLSKSVLWSSSNSTSLQHYPTFTLAQMLSMPYFKNSSR